ncbi:MAG: type II toxin-antitoxin system Phd/YefM family antitoxin [Limnothrix sp. RL_2_0]|nr:type II toxin-antitoxin system Phd/YefM family antitoxin [Limnothrix sp. RL_2_0]
MAVDLRNIHPLSEFQRSAKSFLETLRETKAAMVLTVNGKAAAVVQDAETYQLMVERIELLESMLGIRQSLEEFEQGKGVLLDDAFQSLREKYDIPN